MCSSPTALVIHHTCHRRPANCLGLTVCFISQAASCMCAICCNGPVPRYDGRAERKQIWPHRARKVCYNELSYLHGLQGCHAIAEELFSHQGLLCQAALQCPHHSLCLHSLSLRDPPAQALLSTGKFNLQHIHMSAFACGNMQMHSRGTICKMVAIKHLTVDRRECTPRGLVVKA